MDVLSEFALVFGFAFAFAFARVAAVSLDVLSLFTLALPFTLPLVILSVLRPVPRFFRSPRLRPSVLLVSLRPDPGPGPGPGPCSFPGVPLFSLRPRLLSERPPPSSAPRPRFVPRSGKARSNAATTLPPSTVPNFFARSSAFFRSASALSPSAPLTAMPKRAARAARLASSASGSVDGRFDLCESGVGATGAGVDVGDGAGAAVVLSLDGDVGAGFGAGADTVRSWVLDGSMAAIWFGTATGVGTTPTPAVFVGLVAVVEGTEISVDLAFVAFPGMVAFTGEVDVALVGGTLVTGVAGLPLVSSSQSISSSGTAGAGLVAVADLDAGATGPVVEVDEALLASAS